MFKPRHLTRYAYSFAFAFQCVPFLFAHNILISPFLFCYGLSMDPRADNIEDSDEVENLEEDEDDGPFHEIM